MAPRKPSTPKSRLGVEDLTHAEATRKNIPTVEHQSVMAQVTFDKTPPSVTGGIA